MADLTDNDPPYHIVQHEGYGGKDAGPFSTFLDATFAQQIASYNWRGDSVIMNKTEFAAHQDRVRGSSRRKI